MDLARIEQHLNEVADVVLVDPRSLRHVIKHHRHVAGLVPHGRCYAITKAELVRIGAHHEVELRPGSAREYQLLVARPSPREIRRLPPGQLFERVLRAAFHASVHRALELCELDDNTVRARVEEIGRTEFEEIRATLTHDELLMPPATDGEVYVEFCAVYLELREFSPGLLVSTFPGLGDPHRIDSTIARDVDVNALVATRASSSPPVSRPPAPLRPVQPREHASRGIGPRRHARLMKKAERARKKGNLALCAVSAARATSATDAQLRQGADRMLESAVSRLAERVDIALRGPRSKDPAVTEEWSRMLSRLALRSIDARRARSSPEAKTLFSLQRAAVAYERPGVIVDLPSWILSRGRRPIVRPRDAMRELQVAQIIDGAAEQVQRVRLPSRQRAETTHLVEAASRRAEENVRAALRPEITGVFRRVGLTATSGPERQARNKLVEEVLDRIVERGYLSLPQLRDAISRNEIKLRDLSGLKELGKGDPLLLADVALDIELDGIYRRGDAYLRVLQKASSLPFGTRVGRAITLYAALPLIGSFVVLEGIHYIIGGLLVHLGFSTIDALSWTTFSITALAIFALLHSEAFRIFARQVLDTVGVVLAWIFFRIPRAIFTRPFVKRLLSRPAVRGAIRRVAVPAALGAVAYFAVPLPSGDRFLRGLSAFGAFALVSAFLGSRIGWWLEDLVVDHLAPTWQVFSRHWLPQVLRLIGRAFATLMEGLERGITRIEDALRFRKSRSTVLLAAAGCAGAVWAVIGYVIRLYVTLLIEPELNPLKHFPTVTVAHKVILPFTPDLLHAFNRALSVFGDLVGGAIAGVTVFFLPSVFGFLVWELKENYRLYRATRSQDIPSARLGPHGETMHGLLVVGVHSGTLPKLYERLRRAAQRHDSASAGARRQAREHFGDDPELGRFRERLRAVERSIRRFVERELLPALSTSPRWTLGEVSIARIDLSSNRIRIQLGSAAFSDRPCELTLEQLGGLIVAGLPKAGFIAELDPAQALLFENALAVFYHRAEVDIVREQLESELGDRAHFDIVDEGLVVWPGEGYETEGLYKLRAYRPRMMRPKIQGRPSSDLPVLDSRKILYSHQRIPWVAWEGAWTAASQAQGDVPRLLMGPSLLPVAGSKPRRMPNQVTKQPSQAAGVES